jgi:hypothetical protein
MIQSWHNQKISLVSPHPPLLGLLPFVMRDSHLNCGMSVTSNSRANARVSWLPFIHFFIHLLCTFCVPHVPVVTNLDMASTFRG